MMDLISCGFLRNPFLSIFDFIPYLTVVNNYHISGPYLMDMMWPFPKVCFKHLWFCPIGSLQINTTYRTISEGREILRRFYHYFYSSLGSLEDISSEFPANFISLIFFLCCYLFTKRNIYFLYFSLFESYYFLFLFFPAFCFPSVYLSSLSFFVYPQISTSFIFFFLILFCFFFQLSLIIMF